MPPENPTQPIDFRKNFDIKENIEELKKEIVATIASKADIEKVDELRTQLKNMESLLNDKFENLETDITTKIASQIEIQKTNPIDDLLAPWKETEDKKFSRTMNWDLKSRLERASITKAYLDSTNVTGGIQEAIDPWHSLVQGNPLRNYQRVYPVMGGTVTIPKLDAITFSKEADVPAAARNAQGGISGGAVQIIDNWVSESQFSEPALEDVPNLDNQIEMEHLQQWGAVQGSEAAAKLKASVVAAGANTIQQVTTGVAAALPPKANVISKMADLSAAVGSRYAQSPGAIYAVSRELEAAIKAANDSNIYAFNIAMGVTTLYGYPLIRNDNFDSGGAANEVSGYFGNFMYALYLVERQMLRLDRFMETKPGAVTYFARGRFSQFVVDTGAVAGLITKV